MFSSMVLSYELAMDSIFTREPQVSKTYDPAGILHVVKNG